MTFADVMARAEKLRSGRTPFVLATVVRVQRPTSAKPGDCALLLPDGTLEGFVGGVCAESTVRLHGLRLLRSGESTLLRITPSATDTGGPVEGMVTVDNTCLSSGTLDIFMEAMLPPSLVHVYGEAPIARALVDVGRALGYDVRIADPEAALPEDVGAVVIASHGRAEDLVLGAAVRGRVPYIGLVASRRRGAAVLADLDLTEAQRESVHTPAGLDIGARTAPEIALSVYAELISLRPRRLAGRPEAPAAAEAEAVDPVCGMTVPVTEPTLRAEVGGRTVYFCGPGCQHAFVDDPVRYPG